MTGSVVPGFLGRLARLPRGPVVVGLAVLLVIVGGGVWLAQRPYSTDLDGLADSRAEAVAPGLAARSLATLRSAIAGGDAAAARDLAPGGDPAAGDGLAALVDNAGALQVEGLSMRYLDEVPTDQDAGPGEWWAAVEVSWRFAGFDAGESRVETVVAFAREGDDVAVAGFGPATVDGGSAARTPTWLTGPVAVRRSPTTLVLAADVTADELDVYADRARAAVPAVADDVPDWDRRLVVDVPRDTEALAAAVGSEVEEVAAVAAVTASLDGTPGDDAGGVHVFLNRAVYDGLGPRGAQLVMTHETVHVATRAPGSPAPTWLVEGYADWVALRGSGIGERRAAAQVADVVREEGPPRRLPGPADFDVTGEGAGATYEAAWVACVVLADEVGPDGLRRVYTRVDAGTPVADALDDAGLGLGALTAAWRARLVALADGGRA